MKFQHEIGEVIGKFRLISCLGMGGFGEVWKAEHTELSGKYEVFKFPVHPDYKAMLKKEGALLYKLSHPMIIKITDMDTTSEQSYIRMEYFKGETLEDKIKREKKIPWEKSLNICLNIATALNEAHKQNIIHGDLKPSNIFIDNDEIKVTDFGLGSYITEKEVELSGCLDKAKNFTTGTWDYMAPEQKQGILTSSCDIYSLGVILYRCITGELPRSLQPPSYFTKDCPKYIDKIVINMLSPAETRMKKVNEIERKIKELTTASFASYLSFYVGIMFIIFAMAFLLKIVPAFVVVTLTGFGFIEWARSDIEKFWPLFFFWLGIGLVIAAMTQKLPFRFVGIILSTIGAFWFLSSGNTKEE